MWRRGFIAALFGALSTFLCAGAGAQEGHYGIGHDKWHRDFYATLRRNDGQGPCCSLRIAARPKVAWLATIMKSEWTANGCRFPLTRLATSSRPMVALTSALQNR